MLATINLIKTQDPLLFIASMKEPFIWQNAIFHGLFQHCTEFELSNSHYQSGGFNIVDIYEFSKYYPSKIATFTPKDLKDQHILSISCRLYWQAGNLSKDITQHTFLLTACKIGRDQARPFLNQFSQAQTYMQQCTGFIGYHFYQAIDINSPYQFINLAEWKSQNHFLAAFNDSKFKQILKGGFDVNSMVIFLKQVGIS